MNNDDYISELLINLLDFKQLDPDYFKKEVDGMEVVFYIDKTNRNKFHLYYYPSSPINTLPSAITLYKGEIPVDSSEFMKLFDKISNSSQVNLFK